MFVVIIARVHFGELPAAAAAAAGGRRKLYELYNMDHIKAIKKTTKHSTRTQARTPRTLLLTVCATSATWIKQSERPPPPPPNPTFIPLGLPLWLRVAGGAASIV